MVFDSIAKASVHSAPNSKDSGKKKRVNRSAKLKQCKLDARREQWLSQGTVKNKESKKELIGGRELCCKEKDNSLENLEIRQRKQEDKRSIHQDSDLESLLNSPTSSIGSVLCQNDSGTIYYGSSSSNSSISSRSGGCYSESITAEEEGDDGCLDDWEAIADALAAKDEQQNSHLEISSSEGKTVTETRVADNKPESPKSVPKGPVRAWRPDDDFRPQSLPNLSKQYSLPNLDRQYACGGVPWARSGVISAPSSCPICFEDLDPTDSSFLPCLCGFHLCLFCHKRILEEDGRCPSCRTPYVHDPLEAEVTATEGNMVFKLTRSCSMITRS